MSHLILFHPQTLPLVLSVTTTTKRREETAGDYKHGISPFGLSFPLFSLVRRDPKTCKSQNDLPRNREVEELNMKGKCKPRQE